MRRNLAALLIVVLLAVPALMATAAASFGTLRREAIQAVGACRNMATVSGQLGELTAEVSKEAIAIQEGTPGRIAVIRERLEVIDGKVGELERKVGELGDLGASMQVAASEMAAAESAAPAAPVASTPDGSS
jgi:hypothetical protein